MAVMSRNAITQVSSKSVHWEAFPTFFDMAAVRYLELEICHSGPPTKSAMWFDFPVKIWWRSDPRRRRYCDFMSLPVWLENA